MRRRPQHRTPVHRRARDVGLRGRQQEPPRTAVVAAQRAEGVPGHLRPRAACPARCRSAPGAGWTRRTAACRPSRRTAGPPARTAPGCAARGTSTRRSARRRRRTGPSAEEQNAHVRRRAARHRPARRADPRAAPRCAGCARRSRSRPAAPARSAPSAAANSSNASGSPPTTVLAGPLRMATHSRPCHGRQQLAHPVGGQRDGEQPPVPVSLHQGLAAQRHDPRGVVQVERAGHAGRGDLALRVADDGCGLDARPTRHSAASETMTANSAGWMTSEPLQRRRAVLPGAGRRATDQPVCGGQGGVAALEGSPEAGVPVEQFAGHAGPLRALAGEDEHRCRRRRTPARPRRPDAVGPRPARPARRAVRRGRRRRRPPGARSAVRRASAGPVAARSASEASAAKVAQPAGVVGAARQQVRAREDPDAACRSRGPTRRRLGSARRLRRAARGSGARWCR